MEDVKVILYDKLMPIFTAEKDKVLIKDTKVAYDVMMS
jgi:hypothetical protein